jgi:hypothetical protein
VSNDSMTNLTPKSTTRRSVVDRCSERVISHYG